MRNEKIMTRALSTGMLILLAACTSTTSMKDSSTLDAQYSSGDAWRVTVDGGPSSSRQTQKPLGSVAGAPNGYLEYLPAGYDGTAAVPLLVFWHGIGEDGNGTSDLGNVTAWGPPKVIANDGWDNSRPFIVLSPQYTSMKDGSIAPGAGCPSSDTINTFIGWRSVITTSTRNAFSLRV